MRRLLLISLVTIISLEIGYAAVSPGFGKVTGRVNDANGMPLAGASILLSASFDFTRSLVSVVTNREGEFQLTNLEPGQYAMQVTQRGYQPHLKAPVLVRPGLTTNLTLILQNLISLVNNEDPANWEFKTVLRSSQDRRLIFRQHDGAAHYEKAGFTPLPENVSLFNVADRLNHNFIRAASFEVFAAGPFDNQSYASIPAQAGGGLRTNFSYTLPIGEEARYLMAGQINSGYDSLWKIRNQLDLHLNEFQVWTFSVNYGRFGFSAPRLATLLDPSNLNRDNDYINDRGTSQTLTLSVESYNRILEPITLICGFDVAVLKDASTTLFAQPQFQVLYEPTSNLSFRALMTGRHNFESDAIKLPSGETLNMGDPFSVAQIGRSLRLDRSRHYELGMARRLPAKAVVEIGSYADRQSGAFLPLVAVLKTPDGSNPFPLSLSREQASSKGMHVLVSKKFWDFLSSSVTYIYGSGATISRINILKSDTLPTMEFEKDFFHAMTAHLDADLAKTKTQFSTSFRWAPKAPITMLDGFNDIYGVGYGTMRLTVRQVIPVPDLWGISGRWEALVDLRNIIEADELQFQLPQKKLLLVRNPRFVRLGIAFRM